MSSYAFGGSAGGLCRTNPLTGEHEHAYPSPGVIGIEYGRPIPVHAQTDAALAAVAAVRARGVEGRLLAGLVTDHGTPPVKPYERPEYRVRVTKKGKRKREPTGAMLPANVVTATAKRLVALAERAGFRVNVVELAERCAVEGWHPEKHIGFRAHWHRGRADGGTWHEPYRYVLEADDRPVGVNKVSRTGLVGKRPLGVGTTHLRMTASPKGIPMNNTEIEKKVGAL